MSTLFELLPIGAYRSSVSGRQLRANAALVRLNGYDSEAEMLAAVNDISREWYVDPERRNQFKQLLEREGQVMNFVSEVYRHKTRDRMWIRENAHLVRNDQGEVTFYEGTVEDISASRAGEMALRVNEELFRQVTSQLPGMAFLALLKADGTREYSFVSDGVRELFGVEPSDVIGNGNLLKSFWHPEDRASVEAGVAGSAALGQPFSLQYRIVLGDGTVKWVQTTSSSISSDHRGNLRCGVVLDITHSKRAEEQLRQSEERWKLALESTGDGVWDWHIQSGMEYYSRRYKEMYGYSEDKVWQQSDQFEDIVHPDDKEQLLRDQQAHFEGRTPTYRNEHRVRCSDGSWKWILSRGMVISRDAQGKPVRMIGTHTDITEWKKSEALIWQQANYDPLTGLPNRRMLRDRLEQDIRKCKHDGLQLAILFIDLDHFKEVNDTLGHDSGDLLLIEAADRIRHCVRDSDTVARMGGDEFTVVLSELSGAERLERILQKILGALSAAFQLGDEQVFISASIGITMYPADATEVESLFKNADQALYVAKGAGRNRFSFFTSALQEAAQTRVRLANDLRAALAEQQFRVVYQPIIDLGTGDIRKAEALIRWQHPTRGLISPTEFIPIAESSGLIIDIGEWVFRQAADQVVQWRELHHPHFQISVNKSPVQFHSDGSTRKSWAQHLQSLGLPGGSIAVEITEGLLLDTSATVTQQLMEMRQTGVQVSLDDFGTGYSSLTYLQKFEIDYIKIDQSFVRNLVPSSTDLALCKAIIVMAHELGMKVIAEGVETAQQRDLLVAAGCDHGQGYLFARPMSARDFDVFMASR
ncbi:MAG TPA: EAL domain-containing protein [Burkholderiaceae bacterium]|nr:EAL domain-containing protein [Burkholderiaceae bacterium]